MSEEKISKRRKYTKLFLFKIPIILMIISAILIGALKLVERHPDPLRQGFEQYLSESTRRNATIGVLSEVKFFPNFIIDADNITIHNGANAAIIDLEIKNIKINSPFSTAFLRNRKINDFSLTGLSATADMLGPKAVTVDKAEIVTLDTDEKVGSFLMGHGTYDGEKASFETKLEVKKYNYQIPDAMPFSITIGDYELNATLQPNFRTVSLENLVLSKRDKTSAAKDYLLIDKDKSNPANPLTCLLTEDDRSTCDKYLKVEN